MMFDRTQVSPVLPPRTRHKLGSKNLTRLLLTALHNSPEFTPRNVIPSPRKYHLSLSLSLFSLCSPKVDDLLTSGSINSL